MKIRKVCKTCGGNDVRRDAWAGWDESEQEWTLEEIFDHEYCMECENETWIEDKELNDEEDE